MSVIGGIVFVSGFFPCSNAFKRPWRRKQGRHPSRFFAMGALAPTIPIVGAYASNGAVSHMETGEILRHDHK